MRGRDETVRLFENDLLERLSHDHPQTPLLCWITLIAALLLRRRCRPRLVPGGVAALLLLLAAGGLLATTAAFALDWETTSEKGGTLVERRAVPGSRISAIRVTAHSPLAPAAVFEAIWKQQEHLEFVPFLKRLNILSDTGDERVAYEQLGLPFVQDRDYTVRLRKRVDPAAHRYEILIESANDAGPPPDGSHVRVTNIRGSWTVESGPDGKGSLVRYELQSDPGGSIPAWLADRTQRHAATDLVRAMLKRAQEKNGGK
jgi:ribosome-associated toxin RatA of RatAB toxin-antitoxin module